MHHDFAAELRGYRAELATAEQAGDDDRADAVRSEIGRVHGLLTSQAVQLLAVADGHEQTQMGVLAAQHRARAYALAANVPAAELPESLRDYGFRDADDSTPRETAVRRRGNTNKEN